MVYRYRGYLEAKSKGYDITMKKSSKRTSSVNRGYIERRED